jgi:hypothetical protein
MALACRSPACFTNNLITLTPTSGYWALRSGASEGNGGQLIASGTATGQNLSQLPTGRSGFGYTEYTDAVKFTPLDPATGQYWLAVVPVCKTCNGRLFNSNTDGTNGIGKTDKDNDFFNSPFFGANFTNADNEGTFPAFSSGVLATPEPSSILMLGSGLLAAAGVVKRRLSR